MFKQLKTNLSRKQVLTSCCIILGSLFLVLLLFLTEPTAKRESATKKSAMIVMTQSFEQGDHYPLITATGIVRAAHDVTLQAQVGGEVDLITENFQIGSIVEKGTKLASINSADFQIDLSLAESELIEAEANLALEQGQQSVAQRDFKSFANQKNLPNKKLVLRKPQLNAATAKLKAAKSRVEQAKLNLQRTHILAPFKALIISREITQGSFLSVGSSMARLVGVNEYWVVVNLPLSALRFLDFSQATQAQEDHASNHSVTLRNRTAWPKSDIRTGRLLRPIGELNEQTRLARLIVSVPDPLLTESDKGFPKLVLGEFLEVSIKGRKLKSVTKVPRQYLRKNQTIWLASNNKLAIKKTKIVYQDDTFAYIQNLPKQANIITTNLTRVIEGAKLDVRNQTTQSEKS